MSDIVDRLKAIGNTELSCPLNIAAIQKSVVDYMTDVDTVANAAANEIERLRAQRDELAVTLRETVEIAEGAMWEANRDGAEYTDDYLDFAKAALAKLEEKQ